MPDPITVAGFTAIIVHREGRKWVAEDAGHRVEAQTFAEISRIAGRGGYAYIGVVRAGQTMPTSFKRTA